MQRTKLLPLAFIVVLVMALSPEANVPAANAMSATVLTGDNATSETNLTSVRMPFVSDRSSNPYIYMMGEDGSQTNLTTHGVYDNGPSLSPSGNAIAFTTSRDGNKQIYVMNADGSSPARLTSNKAEDEWPAWASDGTEIAFATNRDGNMEIYLMSASGNEQTRLTDNPAYDSLPTWSPDGSKILFQSNRDGHAEIYVMNADGTRQIRLTNTSTGGSYQPVWLDNGTRIAFTSDRDLLPEIYIMTADGTDQTRLTSVFAGSWTRGKLDPSPLEASLAAVAGSAPNPNEGVITTFQPGHGFTYTSGGGSSADDPTFYSSGTQSLKITTDGHGTQSVVTKSGISPTINISGEIIN